MPILELETIDGLLAVPQDPAREAGRKFSAAYRGAQPFPHIVLDDFLDEAVLHPVLEGFPSPAGKACFDRDQERLKYQYHPAECRSGAIRNLLAELNSQAMLGFLSELTGIKNLIPDPYYLGGGLHETRRGGHLGIHADFNVNRQLNAQRRLNLLIYLNKAWSDSYGGHLELWDRQMKGCVVRVAPLLGRAVIFNTDLDAYHGHPEPLACPPDTARRSIALYYYTVPDGGVASLTERTTVFKRRPGSSDRTDWEIRASHWVDDWAPPRLKRHFSYVVRSWFGRA